jgi:hypothetical protein
MPVGMTTIALPPAADSPVSLGEVVVDLVLGVLALVDGLGARDLVEVVFDIARRRGMSFTCRRYA